VTTDRTVVEDEVLQVIEVGRVRRMLGMSYELAMLKREVEEHEAVKMTPDGTFRSD
jgi:hypothetical protein